MKYCSHCGKEINDEAVMCPYCGCKVESVVNDVPNRGLNIIAFLLPVIGAIMYIIYNEKAPQKAAAIGKWALYGVAFVIICYILLAACSAAMVA